MERCDLCNMPGSIAWTYRTPNEVADEQTAQSTGAFWCEDEEWAVCMDCHILIEEGNRIALLQRSLDVQQQQNMVIGHRANELRLALETEVARIHRLFWEHRDPNPIPEPGYRS